MTALPVIEIGDNELNFIFSQSIYRFGIVQLNLILAQERS